MHLRLRVTFAACAIDQKITHLKFTALVVSIFERHFSAVTCAPNKRTCDAMRNQSVFFHTEENQGLGVPGSAGSHMRPEHKAATIPEYKHHNRSDKSLRISGNTENTGLPPCSFVVPGGGKGLTFITQNKRPSWPTWSLLAMGEG